MSRSPVLAHSREELEAAVGADGLAAGTHLVPTMGALHEGHATLIRLARAQADEQAGAEGRVVVSLFVNPTQFAPGEDFERYPRTLEADLELVSRSGADVVFAPSVEVMYPGGDPLVTVDPGPLGSVLEGAVRPTHFRGVLTVVAKLFGVVGPRAAYFGEKDFQQLVLIRRMAADLCQGVEVVGVPTVREPDGLALSSRNAYLDALQRTQALALSRGLLAGRDAAALGAEQALSAAHRVLDGAAGLELDYLELTGPELGPPPAHGPARLLVAGRVGSTRLIDNLALELAGG